MAASCLIRAQACRSMQPARVVSFDENMLAAPASSGPANGPRPPRRCGRCPGFLAALPESADILNPGSVPRTPASSHQTDAVTGSGDRFLVPGYHWTFPYQQLLPVLHLVDFTQAPLRAIGHFSTTLVAFLDSILTCVSTPLTGDGIDRNITKTT